MVASPDDCAVINPDEFIVAISSASLAQTPPKSPLDVNVVVPLEQIACVPLKVPALGAAVTVTVRVAVAGEQAPLNTV